jgi:putative transposase
MLDLLLLVLMTLRAACRRRGELALENLLLRHQLAILTLPTRQRRRVRCGRLDKLLWVLVRRVRRDWRRHLVVVTPDTVVRWHRAGWRLYWRWKSRAGRGSVWRSRS